MASNPFATRFVRPGAATYLFPDGQSGEQLVQKLAECDWVGQIVGPHGSGKSTLLFTLMPLLAAHGRRPTLVTLHDGQRRLPEDAEAVIDLGPPALLVVDGYEQLSRWRRRVLERRRRRAGTGLLVTAHEPVGLPNLLSMTPSLDAAKRIVRRLLTGQTDRLIADDDIARSYEQCAGNLREMLFALYDTVEARSRARSGP
jgi:DNA replication protein DnaC